MSNTLEEKDAPAPADTRDRVLEERTFASRTVLVAGTISDVSAGEAVSGDIERDRWLSAEEAVDYGLVSRVVERAAELSRPDSDT